MYRNIYRNRHNLQHYLGTFCYKTIEEAKKAVADDYFSIYFKTIEVPTKTRTLYPSIFNIEYEERRDYIIYK